MKLMSLVPKQSVGPTLRHLKKSKQISKCDASRGEIKKVFETTRVIILNC